MKLLLDMGLSPRTAAFLSQLGHDAAHLRDRGLIKLSDREVIQLAANEGRVVVTFDLDYPRILALQRLAEPSVVLFRLESFTTDSLNLLLRDLLVTYQNDLETGAIVVVDAHRVRLRRLPIW
jgi:predicted nuclease of predicted toxin-antitoxin system